MQDAWLIGGAVALGVGAGAGLILAVRARRYDRERHEAEAELPLEFELVPDEPVAVPVQNLDVPRHEADLVPLAVTGPRGRMPLPPILRDARAPPPEPQPIPTEWARRLVGPAPPGRSKGACSGCGAMLSVSNARPLRIACPVCGRTRLLA